MNTRLASAFNAGGAPGRRKAMSTKDGHVATDRRGFLKFAGLGSVAGAVALLTRRDPAGAAEITAEKRLGYRETEHVRRFYESARF
jgi:hypothetical protein